MDLIVRSACRPDDAETVDIGVRRATIVGVERRLEATAPTEIDARGHLVSPPFVDPHFHLDSTLTQGSRDGTPRATCSRASNSGRAPGAPDGGGRRHLSGVQENDACFEAVTSSGARAMGLRVRPRGRVPGEHGRAPGRHAAQCNPPTTSPLACPAGIRRRGDDAVSERRSLGGQRYEVDFSPPGFA